MLPLYIVMRGINMQIKNARTDMASELHSRLENKDIEGVTFTERKVEGFNVTEVNVTNKEGSAALCKPVGKYLTLELDSFLKRQENSFNIAANLISELLKGFLDISNSKNFLMACIGNPAVTPDAIGPSTADSIIITRHLKQSMPDAFSGFSSVSLIRTGVLGTSGVESAAQIKAIVSEVRPDCVIAVDALASADLNRLCRNIQICDSGISPGSGVGNNRAALNKEYLGVPVIAVGVPTVIDASAFSDDEAAKGLFVTPRNIDEEVRSISKLAAYGINLALHNGISVTDIEMLIE